MLSPIQFGIIIILLSTSWRRFLTDELWPKPSTSDISPLNILVDGCLVSVLLEQAQSVFLLVQEAVTLNSSLLRGQRAWCNFFQNRSTLGSDFLGKKWPPCCKLLAVHYCESPVLFWMYRSPWFAPFLLQYKPTQIHCVFLFNFLLTNFHLNVHKTLSCQQLLAYKFACMCSHSRKNMKATFEWAQIREVFPWGFHIDWIGYCV